MGAFAKHNEMIMFLSKRRGQHKKALSGMVKLSMTFIDKIDEIKTKLELITIIRDVCEKKIFLEVLSFSSYGKI